MIFEYATATRSSEGTLDCEGQMTRRTYKNVEFLEDSNVDSPPAVGELGLLFEVHNDEYVWVGRLKQNKSLLIPEEYRLHMGKPQGMLFEGVGEDGSMKLYRATITEVGSGVNLTYNYTITELFGIDEEGNMQMRRQDINGALTSQVMLKNNNEVRIESTTAQIVISPTGAITIVSAGNINITAPVINLN